MCNYLIGENFILLAQASKLLLAHQCRNSRPLMRILRVCKVIIPSLEPSTVCHFLFQFLIYCNLSLTSQSIKNLYALVRRLKNRINHHINKWRFF